MSNKEKKIERGGWGDYVALFSLNCIEMILELVASRLMSPFFGNTNFVWTAIIGIILLAGSLGNLIGGKLASSSKNARGWVMLLLTLASFCIAMIPIISEPILKTINDASSSVQISSVIGSIVLFLVPSTLLGVYTPIIMKERVGEGEDKGKESGRITAIIAIGSLVGTFLGGFFLVPAFGTKNIFVLLGILVLLVVLLMRPWKTLKRGYFAFVFWGIYCFTILFNVLSLSMVTSMTNETSISIDTEYGRIIVEDTYYNDIGIRYYRQSGAFSSATYLNEDKKYDLVFEYLSKYDEMFNFTDVNEVAMIGGAAYQYPEYYISHFPDKKIDVIEIDPEATKIAKKYFFLDDLIEEYGDDRLGLYNEDGRVFMANTDKKYDAILNDAFSGEVPVGTLATVEAAQLIKERLKKDGVYMSNVLGALEGDSSKFLKAEVKTLKKVFKNVYVVPMSGSREKEERSNYMVIATDNDSYVPKTVVSIDLTDATVLTDDYNPVEHLVENWRS